jgi:hypothetical protein
MNAHALLGHLRAAGFRLRADAGMIRVAPAGRVTPDMAQRIRAAKPDLLRLLAAETEANAMIAPFAALLAAAEHGSLTRMMLDAGITRVDLGPGRWTADPDSTVYAAARDVRAVVRDPGRATMPLWQSVVRDRLATLQAISDMLRLSPSKERSA